MKKRALALSLLCLIFMGTPTLAQKVDNGWADEEVARPAPAPQAARGGRWPWTSGRLIQPAELWPLSLGELELMRNEIYARHGYVFNDINL